MERRFEAYKAKVVEPFFRNHFQRVDRQIVLVDVLAAVDAGPAALAELEEALDAVLLSFRIGRNTHPVAPVRAARRAHPVRRHQGRPPPPDQPRPPRRAAAPARLARHAPDRGRGRPGRHRGARLRARHPRDHRSTTATRCCAPSSGTPEAGEVVGDEVFDGIERGRDLPRRAAGAARGGAGGGGRRRAPCASRASARRWSGPTRSGAPATCRRSGSTGRCSS